MVAVPCFQPIGPHKKESVDCVRLPQDSDEFAMAAARCIESVDAEVHDVYRVQNPVLYERFALRRTTQLAREKYGRIAGNEKTCAAGA